VGIATSYRLKARARFSSISNVFIGSVFLCINVSAFRIFCITVTHSVFCITYVLLFTHCSLFIVTLPLGIGPIAIGNKYILYVYSVYCVSLQCASI
jgi:hypothetical protein